jgi:hypothetical protein
MTINFGVLCVFFHPPQAFSFLLLLRFRRAKSCAASRSTILLLCGNEAIGNSSIDIFGVKSTIYRPYYLAKERVECRPLPPLYQVIRAGTEAAVAL